MTTWTHKTDPAAAHPVDPHYSVNGKPTQWVCHECRDAILLDGKAPPITADRAAPVPEQEPSMGAQP